MNVKEFLERVINDGIRAATEDYGPKLSDPHYKYRLDGSIAGFEACRAKTPLELKELLDAAHIATSDAYARQAADYWWYRCYESEVEWVANCLSAILHNQGLPTIIPVTARGVIKAAEIVGVKEDAN